MPGLPNPWLLLGAGLLIVAAAFAGYYKGGADSDAAWRIKSDAQKIEANKLLAKVNADHVKAIQGYIDYANQRETDHDQELQQARDYHNAAPARGGLFDPGRGASCPGTERTGAGDPKTPADAATQQAGVSDAAGAGVRPANALSDRAAAFLRQQAELADEVAVYAASCFRFVHAQ